MAEGFTKLFNTIITSSIWNEDNETRIVWITMLALSNKDGIVDASMSGLAVMARLPVETCKKAIAKLSNPDSDSRTPEKEGRRIEKVDGGWRIINYVKYRNRLASFESVFPKDRKGKIYFIKCGDSIKIGFSKNPWARCSMLKTGMPEEPILLGYFNGSLVDEKKLHSRFSSIKVNREWYKATDDLLDTIAVLCNKTTKHYQTTSSYGSNYNTEAEAEADSTHKNNVYKAEVATTYTLQQVKDACIMNCIPESNAQSYFDQYNSQGWKKGNGQLITNLQSHIAKRWLKSKQCWDFDEKRRQEPETIHEQAERLRKAGELDG